MELANSLTGHMIVVVVDKQERGVGIQALLTKAGFRVVTALSLYDALKVIPQEMPHLVVTESALTDGSATVLYDRLQQHDILKKTPIMVFVVKKTREELQALAQRKFAGFFIGQLEPRALLGKILEVMAAHSKISPYFLPAQELKIAPEMTISVESLAVGRSGEHLVVKSPMEVDSSANILCVPTNPDLGSVVLRMASNLKERDDIFNLFPISRIVGLGRKWVANLPETSFDSAPESAKSRRKLIFFEPNEQRLQSFLELLSGYGFEATPAKSLAAAAACLKRDADQVGCVYLHELTNDAHGIEWKKIYGSLPANRRPSLVVGTSSLNSRSTTEVRYIKRPFGIGTFIEMLEAAFEKGGNLVDLASKSSQGGGGVPVRFQAPAGLVGLDETGGIIEVRFPLFKGSKVNVSHAFLEKSWEGNNVVQIASVAPAPGKTDAWHARFEVVQAGMSKVKYWEKISKSLQALEAASSDQMLAKSS